VPASLFLGVRRIDRDRMRNSTVSAWQVVEKRTHCTFFKSRIQRMSESAPDKSAIDASA